MSITLVFFHVGTATIALSSVVRDLGIYIDSNLSMTAHISKTVSSCFSAMRLIRSVRRSVSKAVSFAHYIACFVACWLWQCNARGATCTPTLSAAVRPPRRCSDSIQCPEVRSRDATAPRTTLGSGADHFQAGIPRLSHHHHCRLSNDI